MFSVFEISTWIPTIEDYDNQDHIEDDDELQLESMFEKERYFEVAWDEEGPNMDDKAIQMGK